MISKRMVEIGSSTFEGFALIAKECEVCLGRLVFFLARKKSTKINFLGPETARWGGGLRLEGVVAKNFAPALKSLSSLGFEERNLGCPGNFAGMSRTPGGVQKVCAKTFRAHFSFPILVALPHSG